METPDAPHSDPPILVRLTSVYLWALVAYILFTRLAFLGLKAVQHDESMFSYYAWIFRTSGNYVYADILHGPVLELLNGAIFKLIGDSDYTMRLWPALSGIGLLAVIWRMRDLTGWRATYFALGFLAISPTVTFFSRFCRNDISFLFVAMLIVYTAWRYSQKPSAVRLIALPLLFALAMSIMETYVIFAFLLATFCLGCWIHGTVKRIAPSGMPVYGLLRHAVLKEWHLLLCGSALGFGLIVTLFTTFFQNREKWNGPYTAIKYWAGQHAEHRIYGLFHFHLLHLLIYEVAFLLFWLICLTLQMWPRNPDPGRTARRYFFAAWVILSYLTLVIPVGDPRVALWKYELPKSFDTHFHITMGLHIWIIAQLFIVIGITGWNHLNRGRVFHAFVDYWAAGSFLAYGYAGEKVPWVTMHIVVPMLISCGMYADIILRRMSAAARGKEATEPFEEAIPGRIAKAKSLKEKQIPRQPAFLASWRGRFEDRFPHALRNTWIACAAIGLGWEIWLSIFVCFFNSGSPIERHTYASSHWEFHREMKAVVREAYESFQGEDTPIAFQGEVAWPLFWTLRRFKFQNATVPPNPTAPFVIIDQYIMDGGTDYAGNNRPPFPYKDRYDWKRVRFRYYWQPLPLDWSAMKRWWLLLRDPAKLSPEQQIIAETCRNDWGKLWTAMILRDEDIHGPKRWDHLGGIDAYIGRIKPAPAGQP